MHFRDVKGHGCNRGNVEMRQKHADNVDLRQVLIPVIIPLTK